MTAYIVRIRNSLGGWSDTIIHASNQTQAKLLAEGQYGRGNVTMVGEAR